MRVNRWVLAVAVAATAAALCVLWSTGTAAADPADTNVDSGTGRASCPEGWYEGHPTIGCKPVVKWEHTNWWDEEKRTADPRSPSGHRWTGTDGSTTTSCGEHDDQPTATATGCGHTAPAHDDAPVYRYVWSGIHRGTKKSTTYDWTESKGPHNHCDDDTHPSDHDNDTCPEDVEVCPVPAAPTVTKHEKRDGPPPEQLVKWEVDDPEGEGCEVTGWLIYYGTDAARAEDRSTRESWERRPGAGSRIRVYVRAENPVHPDDIGGTKQLGNSGWVDLDGDDVTVTPPVCAVPDAPVLTRDTADGYDDGYTTVEWTRDETQACPITGQQLRITRPRHTVSTPSITKTAEKYTRVPAPTPRSTPVTVEVRAANEDKDGNNQWSGWGKLDLPYEPTVTVCPRPDAPTVTKHGFRTRGGVEEQEVRWEIRNPPASPCEITGQRIRYGTGTPRELAAGIRKSWEPHPGPGSRIRVYVSVKNPVRTDRTGEQWSDAGWVDLYGECPAGTTHAGKPMDDPAVGGTVEGCNNDGCPLPAAPVLTASGTGSSRAVTWTVDDPAGEDCEITGQELRRVPQRGISSTRDRDKNTRESTQSVTDRTGAVVVSVRAKNRAQPGSSDQRCGGLVTVRVRARNQVG